MTNEQTPQPFTPFPQGQAPTPPVTESGNGADAGTGKKPRRGARRHGAGRRPARAGNKQAGRPARKTREPAHPAPSRPAFDLPQLISALAGCTEEDGKFITGVVQAMQAFDDAQRSRIMRALGKLFP